MRAQVRATKTYVVMRMTHKQAMAMGHALGNSTAFPDVMDALFEGDGQSHRRALEADKILWRAISAIPEPTP